MTHVELAERCLRAAVYGPFFPDWEFQTLVGLTRAEVRDIHRAWPTPTAMPEDIRSAVHNSANNLLGYPHQEWSAFSRYLEISPEALRAEFEALVAWLDRAFPPMPEPRP